MPKKQVKDIKDQHDCIRKMELDYHSSLPIQNSIQYEHYVDITAEPFIDAGPVEFNVVGTPHEYIDMAKSYVIFSIHVQTATGGNLDMTSTELTGKYLTICQNVF